jgi:hypothetical protein
MFLKDVKENYFWKIGTFGLEDLLSLFWALLIYVESIGLSAEIIGCPPNLRAGLIIFLFLIDLLKELLIDSYLK